MANINITATGKSVEEALENAKKELSLETLDGLEIKILEQPKKGGLFGLGSKLAKVAVFSPAEEEEIAPKKEEKQTKAKDMDSRREKLIREKREEKKAEKKAQEKPKSAEKAGKQEKPEASDKQEKAEKTEAKQETAVIKTPAELENDASLKFVRTVLSDLQLTATAEMYIDDEGMRRIVVTGADATKLIGHHGDTLDSFQYLANLASSKKDKKEGRVTVDIENYRAKREAALRTLARRMAARALKYRRSVMLEPMNPYERRIIHSEIQNIEGVSTNSIGTENNRKIVIFLTDKKEK